MKHPITHLTSPRLQVFGKQPQSIFPKKLSIFHELCKRFRQNPLAGGRATNILDSPRIKPGASLYLSSKVYISKQS